MRTLRVVLAVAILSLLLALGLAQGQSGTTARGKDLATVFNTAKTTSNDLVSFVPQGSSSKIRITVQVSGSISTLNLRATSGATTVVLPLNAGVALSTGVLYGFEVDVSPSYTYTLRVGTNCTIDLLHVREVY
jgi:hypothetical protein